MNSVTYGLECGFGAGLEELACRCADEKSRGCLLVVEHLFPTGPNPESI
jgi:hypothetical protein